MSNCPSPLKLGNDTIEERLAELPVHSRKQMEIVYLAPEEERWAIRRRQMEEKSADLHEILDIFEELEDAERKVRITLDDLLVRLGWGPIVGCSAEEKQDLRHRLERAIDLGIGNDRFRVLEGNGGDEVHVFEIGDGDGWPLSEEELAELKAEHPEEFADAGE
jgi:hypothetical protein